MSSTDLDETLISYGTPRQQEVAKAVAKYGTREQAAIALGMTSAGVRSTLSDLRRRAARMGWAPEHDMTKPAPEGFHIKGTSTLYGEDGSIRAQWVKTNKDQEEKLQALLDACANIAEPLKGQHEPIPEPKALSDNDLLSAYLLGDSHVGMYSWHEETGESFDLSIAERHMVTATRELVAASPASEQALIVNVGDYYHADNPSNQTARSGHPLDVDTRWSKVFDVGVRIMRLMIDLALEKHRHVRVVNELGNHDDVSAIVLSKCLELYYSREPRVTIDTSPARFHYYRHGKCLLGVTHGDKAKAPELPGIMACDRPKDWGETEYRHFYCGHVHHDSKKEYRGCTVETIRTLAAKDAWHAGSGYRSGRDMKCDVWHREWGHKNRYIIGIREVEAASAA